MRVHRVAQVFTPKQVASGSTVGKVTHYRDTTIAACRAEGQLNFDLIQGVGRFRSAIPATRRV